MTKSEEAEFSHLIDIGIKRCVTWYRAQDFSKMNEDARAELESIISPGDEYDVSASLQIGVNMMMIGQVWQDKRFMAFAARAARTSCDVKTMGRLSGKVSLRQLLDEISVVLSEPQFLKQ